MKCMLLVFVIVLALNALISVDSKKHRPHIIYIYADDLGWGDLSLHGSPEIPTPNIDALAMNGILLNNYYGQWLCTPSRASLMSGKYPHHLGFQHFLLLPGQQGGLPLDVETLPQYLEQLGYKNHMIGKWHLGYMTKEYFPTRRGFHSFFGYVNGLIDYNDYTFFGPTLLVDAPTYNGIDLYNDTTLIKNFRGPYVTDVFNDKAVDLIRHHNPHTPMFLYLSHTAVHGGNLYMPNTAPPQYMKRAENIPDVNRKIHAARTIALDDSVGAVFKALDQKGMLDNSIVLFVSDNGGDANSDYNRHGSNFPLRGTKHTLWEGGMRVPAVVWSPLLKGGRVSNQLMSVIDWLPTLYSAAGGNADTIQNIDGIDMWSALKDETLSPRKELLYNVDYVDGVSAIRVGDLKVVNGTSIDSNSWYNKPTFNCYNTIPQSRNCKFNETSDVRNILVKKGMWNLQNTNNWRKKAAIACTERPDSAADSCKPDQKPCLYDLATDPCEYKNIADQHPDIVEDMMNKITSYASTALKVQFKPSDPKANPQCHDFGYVPWLEPEFFNNCQYYTSAKSSSGGSFGHSF